MKCPACGEPLLHLTHLERGARCPVCGQSPCRAAPPAEPSPEEVIFRMPSLEEVVAAWYFPSYIETVRREHDELVARFRADPEFRAEAIRRWKIRQEEESGR